MPANLNSPLAPPPRVYEEPEILLFDQAQGVALIEVPNPLLHKDVMLDLETLSTMPNAAIAVIAAVAFDRQTGKLGPEFCINLNLESVQKAGLHIDAATVMWWLNQPKEAQERLQRTFPTILSHALAALCVWFDAHIDEDAFVWGNGATFDNVILHSAFRADGSKAPWSHKRDSCFRTMKNMFPDVQEPAFVGTPHDALDDARHQARWLCAIFAYLRESFAIAP